MKARPWARWTWVIGALLATVAASATKAEEKPWSRTYRGELYPIVQVLGGDTTSFLSGALELKTDTTPVFGAGMGLNWDDHFNINTEFLVGRLNTTGTSPLVPGVSVDMDVTAWLWNVNLDYNIFKGRLTPLVTGGVGFIILSNHDENVNETDFSYHVGVGGRWDIADCLALRVVYRWTWAELEDADDPSQFDGVTANVIFMF